MKRSSPPRATAELSDSLHHRLNSYALAASAAGVGVLAVAQPADAKIVYTPAHVVVSEAVPLDLNHDGIVDFTILNTFATGGDFQGLEVCQIASETSLKGYFRCYGSTNMVRAKRVRNNHFLAAASALPRGAEIQTRNRFAKAVRVEMGYFYYGCCGTKRWDGPWFNDGKGVKNRYLGLKFKIKGKFHFGWARLTVETTQANFTAILTGYAYETIPGKPIIAGKTKGPDDTTVAPTSLGHLAAGASAIPAWRVKRTQSTTH
ncbi:MAG TPA: hypothetical protein VK788_27930 [Terriglobales bacterium]|jgi:hypothetical protein|nr:hypothetical protein [Terriglobales bacterium]